MIKKVLITGATGNIGSYAIPQLIKEGVSVRAYVHNKAHAEKINLQGVEIIEGDYLNNEALEKAAKGTDAVVSITAANPDAVAQASVITNAAKLAGVKHLVRISAIKAGKDAPTENGKLHFETDMEIDSSNIPYTIVRPDFYMQNIMMSIPTILKEGNIYSGVGEGRIGLIDTRDIADCVVRLLLRENPKDEIHTLTGPASIGFTEIAKIISRGTGRTVNYVQVSPETIRETLKGMGAGDWAAQVMMDYSNAYSEGWGDIVTNDVKTITGHKARSFQEFFDEVMSKMFKQTATY